MCCEAIKQTSPPKHGLFPSRFPLSSDTCARLSGFVVVAPQGLLTALYRPGTEEVAEQPEDGSFSLVPRRGPSWQPTLALLAQVILNLRVPVVEDALARLRTCGLRCLRAHATCCLSSTLHQSANPALYLSSISKNLAFNVSIMPRRGVMGV